MRIAIVEDERIVAEELYGFIKKFEEKNEISSEVKIFENGVTFLQDYNHNFDLIFMDIEMPNLDGMTTVKRLRQIDSEVMVIFVTNLARYAVKGYEVEAFDFIVKPIVYPNFVLKYKRALKKLGNLDNNDFWISTRRGKKLIKIHDIKYIEVMKHVIIYHTKEGDYTGSGTLKSISESFPERQFSLCNRCYLVNLHYVKEVVEYSVFVDDVELQISVAKRKTFIRALNNYLGS